MLPSGNSRPLCLLVDSVPVASPGILQLRNEFATVLATQTGDADRVVLLSASAGPQSRRVGRLTEVPVAKPRAGWAGRWWWYNVELPRLARVHKADVVFSMSGILSSKLCRTTATLGTVNNMLPFMPDNLDLYPRASVSRLRFDLLRWLYVRSLNAADAVILHSQHALTTVSRYTGDISEKTVVALTGVPSDIATRLEGVGSHPRGGEPYLFYFSAFHRYKNHFRVLDAYQRSVSLRPGMPHLVLAGFPADPGYRDRVLAEIERRGLQARVRVLGVLDRSAIPGWIRHAEVNLFASTCETNPVTVAEILAIGGVLACSEVAPMTEVAAGAAAYFDPGSSESIAKVLLTLMDDGEGRARLREQARQRARELSWKACASEIWRSARNADQAFRCSGRGARA